MSKKISPFVTNSIIFALAATALLFAIFLQYAMHYPACSLCVMQRYPYIMVLIFCSYAAIRPQNIKITSILSALMFFTTAGIAIYHVGVEMGFFHSNCSFNPGSNLSLQELKKRIMSAPKVSCDQASAVFLGVSLAGWNILYGLFCAIYTLYLLLIKLEKTNDKKEREINAQPAAGQSEDEKPQQPEEPESPVEEESGSDNPR